MTSRILNLSDVSSWPPDLLEFLDKHRAFLACWERNPPPGSAALFDTTIAALHEMLTAYRLIGWHCSRLTDNEIAFIAQVGMFPPSAEFLRDRIDEIENAGIVSSSVAERLRIENQAHETNRAGKIWFCFFPPYQAGQSGIERFFRRWGGEALYNLHESNSETGDVLAQIGRPCLIEAEVAIETLRENNLALFVYRIFLAHHSIVSDVDSGYEDFSTCHVPASMIRRIIVFPEDEFLRLTGCEEWREPLE